MYGTSKLPLADGFNVGNKLESCDYLSVFCPGIQKGRVPSEKGTFSAVNGSTEDHH